ncbi:MAG TPA: hypothetical protein DCX46_00700 [Bacteroidetes bacterium]|nr:hypothetical protein [Bacteroidota bacterium]
MDDVNNHWTDDEDLLERFVLDRIATKERDALEKHLEACWACKMRVENEIAMVQALRLEGRFRLKQELKKLVAGVPPVQSVGWRWVAAAALLLAVGTWLVRREPVPDTIVKDQEVQVEEASPRLGHQPPSAAQGQPTDRLAERRRTDVDRQSTGPDRADAAATSAGAGTEQRRRLPREEQPARAAEEALMALEGAAVPLADAGPDMDVWVTALVIDEKAKKGDTTAAGEGQVQPLTDFTARAAQAPSTAKKGLAMESVDRPQFKLKHNVSVRQESQLALPATQQATLTKDGGATFPAKLQQLGDTLVVTLYPESRIQQVRLDQSVVASSADDTLFIMLEGQYIVVPLPAAIRKK